MREVRSNVLKHAHYASRLAWEGYALPPLPPNQIDVEPHGFVLMVLIMFLTNVAFYLTPPTHFSLGIILLYDHLSPLSLQVPQMLVWNLQSVFSQNETD